MVTALWWVASCLGMGFLDTLHWHGWITACIDGLVSYHLTWRRPRGKGLIPEWMKPLPGPLIDHHTSGIAAMHDTINRLSYYPERPRTDQENLDHFDWILRGIQLVPQHMIGVDPPDIRVEFGPVFRHTGYHTSEEPPAM